MTRYASYGPAPRRQAALPLVLAGAAFAITLWLVADRAGWLRPAPVAEPRPVTPRGELADFEKTVIEVFEQNKPSVVHLTAIGRTYLGDYARYPEGTGTGFLWDDRGTIVTNYHVVQNVVDALRRRPEGRILVSMEQGDYEARYVDGAPGHDIAVLQLVDPPSGLRPVLFGESSDLKVGQTVLAIGNPFGLDQTLTTGVVSALDRSLTTKNGILNGLIQTDASINPGNSGGPLMDSAGRVIGMNTAIYSPSGASAGIGFAVPADTINAIVSGLLSGEDTQRALGIESREAVRWRVGRQYVVGLPVFRVLTNSGAGAAGLRPFRLDERGNIAEYGDIILEVSGVPVRAVDDIRRNLKGRQAGEMVPVKILRTGPDDAQVFDVMVEVR